MGKMTPYSMFLFGLTLTLHVNIFSVIAEPDPKVRFFCIHPSDTTYMETSLNDEDMLKNLNFELDFVFLVHGWQSEFNVDKKDDPPYKIGLAWVKAQKVNFCGVDWKALAADGYYDAAMKHVKTAGKQLAAFIAALKKLNGKVDSISIAGHSLGAHVAGFAAKTVYELNKTKISTIYGLDPAGPLFTFSIFFFQSDFCLSQKDANFVQILHTTSALGTGDNIGHADFIVNGGDVQKACLDELARAEDFLIKCSHSHAKDIFLSSFTHSCAGFIEVKLKSESESGNFMSKVIESVKSFFSKAQSTVTDVYGIHSKKIHGVFELKTSKSAPYCEKEL